MTKQRKLIHDILAAKPLHLTAEEIYEKAVAVMPSIARGTVYRNLGLMVEAGEILKLDVPEGPARYDRNPAPHAHLVCQRCGAVEDIVIEGLVEKMEALCGRSVTGCDLKLYHICDHCQSK